MSGKRILIRGGTVVLPHAEVQTNLLIIDGKIAAVDAAWLTQQRRKSLKLRA
ncbi:MAG: hypothetical protein U0892_02095 [Pirellulales bacterium]